METSNLNVSDIIFNLFQSFLSKHIFEINVKRIKNILN